MQTRMQPGPLNDLCGVMTTKVGLHICGRVYSSLRGMFRRLTRKCGRQRPEFT
jgi:hypothetical protein